MREFNPQNPVVKLCIQAMAQEADEHLEQAKKVFQEAWNTAENDHERFLTAFFMARHQESAQDELKWLEDTLELALRLNDERVRSAFPVLYRMLANTYRGLNEIQKSNNFRDKADACDLTPTDPGPFYHGTRADLQRGDYLNPGGTSNYDDRVTMNHIYFTAVGHTAGLAASMARGEGSERVYVVETTGDFEDDPNVTNLKFPGNPTRSYRSATPLKIIGEIKDWSKQTPEELQKWKARLAQNSGEIIN